MNYAMSVRMRQGFGELNSPLKPLLQRDLLARGTELIERRVQRSAWQIFQSQERMSVRIIDIVNRRDVGMIQRRHRQRLLMEPRCMRIWSFAGGRQELERHRPLQL